MLRLRKTRAFFRSRIALFFRTTDRKANAAPLAEVFVQFLLQVAVLLDLFEDSILFDDYLNSDW